MRGAGDGDDAHRPWGCGLGRREEGGDEVLGEEEVSEDVDPKVQAVALFRAGCCRLFLDRPVRVPE